MSNADIVVMKTSICLHMLYILETTSILAPVFYSDGLRQNDIEGILLFLAKDVEKSVTVLVTAICEGIRDTLCLKVLVLDGREVLRAQDVRVTVEKVSLVCLAIISLTSSTKRTKKEVEEKEDVC